MYTYLINRYQQKAPEDVSDVYNPILRKIKTDKVSFILQII